MTRPATHAPEPPTDIDDAIQRVRAHGGRMTAAKRALIELLHEDGPALTAEQIVDRLATHDRSAVYRNLAQLEDLGIAEHIHLGHGQAVYRPTGRPEIPVVCNACGAVAMLARADARAFVATVAELTGVDLDLTHFPLTGTCRACADRSDRG